MSFENINNSLNAADTVKVSIVTLAGVNTVEVAEGMTIADFKTRNNLEGTKIVDKDGDALSASDVITEDMELFVSTPKKNG